MSVTSSMARGAVAYALATMAQRGIGFLLLPVYSRFLLPNEYGQIAILITLYSVTGIVFSFGLEPAVFRGYFKYSRSPDQQVQYLGSVGTFILLFPTVAVLMLTIALLLSSFEFHGIPRSALVFELLAAAWFASFSTYPLSLIRAEERLRIYIKVTAVFAMVQTFTRLGFVVGLGWSVTGWVLADLIAAGLTLPLGLYFIRKVASPRWDTRKLREALSIGVPLLPHFLSHWALGLSDRLIIGAFLGTAAAGIYAMGYTITSLAGLVINELNRAAMPYYGHLLVSKNETDTASNLATHQLLATLVIGFSAALLGPSVVHLLLDPAYASAAKLIPPIAAGLTLFGFYYIPMNSISLVAGKTGLVWSLSAGAGLVNIMLNLFLVDRFGIQAAAYNTFIGYAILLTFVTIYQRKVAAGLLNPNIRRVTQASIAALLTWMAASYLFDPSQITGALSRLMVVVVGAISLFAPEVSSSIARRYSGNIP